jgi:flagellar hook-length control protein FliK
MKSIDNATLWAKSHPAGADTGTSKPSTQNIDASADSVFQNMLASKMFQNESFAAQPASAQTSSHQSEREIDHGRTSTQHANHLTSSISESGGTEANPNPGNSTNASEHSLSDHPVYTEAAGQASASSAQAMPVHSSNPVAAALNSAASAQDPPSKLAEVGADILSGVQSVASLGATLLTGTVLGQGAAAVAGMVGKVADVAQTLGSTVDGVAGIGKAGALEATQSASLSEFKATAASTLAQAGNDKSGSTIQSTFGTAQWDQEINQKVVWMVGGAEQSASLTLNPPDLGPLQVVVHVHNNMANATFISDNPEVRQALTDGLQSLRDMMSQSGLTLGQTNVSSGDTGRGQLSDQSRDNRNAMATNSTGQGSAISAVGALRASNLVASKGLVDTFA